MSGFAVRRRISPMAFTPSSEGSDSGSKVWMFVRSEEHTSELQSHRDLHSFLHDALPILTVEDERLRGAEADFADGVHPEFRGFRFGFEGLDVCEIGRASCRERV